MTSPVGFLHQLVNASMLKGRHTKSSTSVMTTSGVIGDEGKMAAMKIGRSSSSSAVIHRRPLSDNWQSGGFDRLLDSTIGIDLFTSFLQRERSEENLVFWRQCNFYRKAINRKRMARIMYEEFIDESAPNEVNIDATIRDAIKRRLAEAPDDLFDEAQRHVYQLMKRDPYKRFIVSRMYRTVAELREADVELERLRLERVATDKSRTSLKPSMRFSWHGGKTTSKQSERSVDAAITPNGEASDKKCAAQLNTGLITDASVRNAATPEALAKKHRSVKKMFGRMVRNLSSKLSSAADNTKNNGESETQAILSTTTTTTTSSDISIKTFGDVTLTPQCFDRVASMSTHSTVEMAAASFRRRRRKNDGSRGLVNVAASSRECSLSSQINVFERQHHRSTFSGFKSKFERLKHSVINHHDDVIAPTGNGSIASSGGVSFTNRSLSSAAGTDVGVGLDRRSRRQSNTFERSLASRQQVDRNVSSTPVAAHRRTNPRRPASRDQNKSNEDSQRVFVYYL